MTPQLLDVLSFPLHGSRLIEASAGTGKTFTIAALYVRLVLGHGGDAAFARPMTPPEILVVTFTDAATKELRDRIRSRLADASAAFLDASAENKVDDFLRDLRAEYPAAQWPACARKLQLAAEWMDEAAVSTIHGWCARMLGEHAFDSGSLFNEAVEADLSDLLAEVVRDYWRTFFYPLDRADAATIEQWWTSPDGLHRELKSLLPFTAALAEANAPSGVMAATRAFVTQALADIKRPWAAWADELEAILNAAADNKQVNGTKLRRDYFTRWLAQLRDWALGQDASLPFAADSPAASRLTIAGLADAWKVGEPPDHPALHAMPGLHAQVHALPTAHDDVLRHAARWVAARLDAEMSQRAQMGFDDLLTRLDAALHGPNGVQLAAMIRAQFPVALIDEFQDTDPLQYRIFDAIYRVADNDPSLALVLIGDPKQAIYAFRGADIHTYLRARRDTDGRHYTLGTNYRSTLQMVEAVNHVFGLAEQRESGHGAFLFRGEKDNPVPFFNVSASGRDERLMVDGRDAHALNFLLLHADATVSKTAYVSRMAQACADEIVLLLSLSQEGRAGFAAADAALKPLEPGHIAVLVNNFAEASSVRQALAAGGVRSVYMSDQESVYQSAQAWELQCWLAACANPEDDRLLRAALATPSLGLQWSDLDRLNQDEVTWEDRVLQFRAYRHAWRKQGVLPMVRRLLGDFGVPARLLAARHERALTDLLHLAELLQQASVLVDGEHALIRHLAEHRAQDTPGNDARKLRLESDAALVKVITVHKSKGLEYPLVFLPFAGSMRLTKDTDLPLKWHDEAGELQVALSADPQAVALVDRERLGEDLRKLYVALTRARHATWVGLAPLENFERSAPGYLLAGGDEVPSPRLHELLQSVAAGAQGTSVAVLSEPAHAVYRDATEDAPLGAPLELTIAQREPWWVTSYSGLQVGSVQNVTGDEGDTATAPGATATAESAAQEIYAESREPSAQEQPAWSRQAGAGMHGFPRGPAPGTFLHSLLEWAADAGFANVVADPAIAADIIERRCSQQGWSRWTATLGAWLPQLLSTPLPLPEGSSVRLCDVEQLQVELEFWFSINQANTLKLDELVTRGTLGRAPRPPLLPQQLNGMLKGFIDLVFEHDGRYYVADYKSNWLGDNDAAYTPASMRDAVLHHRYDLQYALYVFALHRLLKSRLPDYDYDRHVGGAVYIFLRATHAPTHGVHAERLPRELIEAMDALFAGAEAAA